MAVILDRPKSVRGKPVRRLYTAEDLLKMPREKRVELIRGELIPLPPPPGGEHGELADSIGSRASVYVRDHQLGRSFAAETGFKVHFDPDTVRGPDWAFVRKERLPGPVTKKHVPVVPDIVLEVRSPDDSRREFAEKVSMWIGVGVQIVWALDPDSKTLTVHREHEVQHLGPKDTLTGEEILPGFELPLSKVFTE
jgi:Uma2 family endonuclease